MLPGSHQITAMLCRTEERMQLTCLACGATVESTHRDFERAMQETKYRPIFPEKGVKWLCATCASTAEEHAAALLELLKGESVPLWHLLPEKRRLKIAGNNVPAADRADGIARGG